jgi:hypothetical protein
MHSIRWNILGDITLTQLGCCPKTERRVYFVGYLYFNYLLNTKLVENFM